MDKFLQQDDALGSLINGKAEELYQRMQKVDADSLGLPAHCLSYFKSSHSKRLFFSVETSAHLLYRSLTLAGRKPGDTTIMDYGGGVGTLYLLARMIGCQVIYNDHLDDWRLSAELIAKAVGIDISHYIVGDIDSCLDRLDELHISCDIITSRNVIEHIYKLDNFYDAIYKRQPKAVVFCSTTANSQNPASVIKHRRWHRKWEKAYLGKRAVAIERQSPGLSATRVRTLAKASRGLAMNDLAQAVDTYRRNGRLPDPSGNASNTCDPANGVWAEHLISPFTYRELIDEEHYAVSFAPGFWDTHYAKGYMNTAAKLLNAVIAAGGKLAMMVAPFIYVIAVPEQRPN